MSKVVLSKSNFKKIDLASSMIKGNQPKEILSHLLFKFENKDLTVSATNLESYIQVVLDYSYTETDFDNFSINARSVLNIMKNTDTDIVCDIDKAKNKINMKAGKFKATFNIFSKEDFPTLPEKKDTTKLEVSIKLLSESIKNISYATLKLENNKPYLNGVFINNNSFVASDGFRLAYTHNGIQGLAEKGIILPNASLLEICKILDICSDHDKAEIELTDKTFNLNIGNIHYATRLIDQKYPQFKQVMVDKSQCKEVIFNRFDMVNALNILRETVSENNKINLDFNTENNITIETQNTEKATTSEYKLTAQNEEMKMVLPFNYNYLIDFAKASKDETIKMYIKDTKSQSLFVSSNFEYICMPMRI